MQYDQEKIVLRFNDLINLAEEIWNETNENKGIVGPVNVAKLRANARHLLTLLLPGSKVYLEEWDGLHLERQQIINTGWYKGILLAAKEDYIKGLFGDQKLFICAEVFIDFLQQAEYLLKEGYKDAAAVIAGSVFEDGLRRLCVLKRIDYGEKETINPLNQKLYKESVYNKLWYEEVSAKAVIRNDAAHGKYDGYGPKDVQGLIDFIKRFLREFLETH